MMNYNEFKKILSSTKRKILLVGIIMTVIGALGVIGTLMSEGKVAYWFVAGISLSIGLFALISSILELSKISADKHPLLSAIKNEQKDYLIWIYINEIAAKVEGVQVSTSSNIVLYTKTGKQSQLVLSRKVSPEPVIEYLVNSFPGVHYGYETETRHIVGELLNKKL